MREQIASLKHRLEEITADLDNLLAAGELVAVVVKLAGSDVKRAFLAGRKVHFEGDTGRLLVPHGKHRLLVDVVALPGTVCTVGIVAPAEAAFERTFTVDDDGATGGVFTINI